MKFTRLNNDKLTNMAETMLSRDIRDVRASRSEELINIDAYWDSKNIDFSIVEGVIVTFTDPVTYKKRKMVFQTIQKFVNRFYKAVDALDSELKLLKSQCLHKKS